MKVDIKADGTLVITPENEIEAYAVVQWSSLNFTNNTVSENIIFDMSGFVLPEQAKRTEA